MYAGCSFDEAGRSVAKSSATLGTPTPLNMVSWLLIKWTMNGAVNCYGSNSVNILDVMVAIFDAMYSFALFNELVYSAHVCCLHPLFMEVT